MKGNNNSFTLYDWLADSATTSHIANMQSSFQTFEPIKDIVNGVSNMKTHAKGRGTVKVTSFINGQHYQFLLTDMLYVPTNTHNLLSLGRWDTASSNYHGGQGILTMRASNGDTVAVGTKLSNNLYRLQDFKVSKPETTNSINRTYAFQNNTNLATWEIWHRRFGHLGLTSLQTKIWSLASILIKLVQSMIARPVQNQNNL